MPLIVESDGTVVPVEYSFGRQWALGNLRDARLPVLAARWKRERMGGFHALCQRVQRQATAADEPAVINWYGRLAQASASEAAREEAPA